MLLIITLLCCYYLVAVIFLLKGLLALPKRGNPQNLTYSVIIAARNEEANICDCLDSVLAQTLDSQRYELIVVNDRSTDSTGAILAQYSSRFSNFSCINISETPPGISPKKYAVSKGINAARHEIVVFTDADCRVSPGWLAAIDSNFTADTGLLQGITSYVYLSGMNRWFYGLQAVDFISHGIVAAAGIGMGLPINSNANNLAFRRSVFTEVDGYGEQGKRVTSGDDDLLLQRVWNSSSWRVSFMFDPEGAVQTFPTPTVKGVFEQRKRWGSKTVHYGVGQVAFLSGIFLFYLAIPAALITGLWSKVLLVSGVVMLLVKVLGELLIMIPGLRRFGRRDLLKYVIPGSVLQLPMVLFAVVMGVFGKFSWKEQLFSRTVNSGASQQGD